jgi:hypothetical protein
MFALGKKGDIGCAYLITSSAQANRAGTVRPSTLAVLRVDDEIKLG